MEKKAIKDIVYGGIEEILNNRAYYYHSNVGMGYSHFTEEGKAAVAEFLELMAFKMKEAEDEDLNYRSKKILMEQLKGEVKKENG